MTEGSTFQPPDDDGSVEENLPPKPPIDEPMPSDEELDQQPEPGEEDVPDEGFLHPDEAKDDDTIDDEEQMDGPPV
jgi:hypothetical protein